MNPEDELERVRQRKRLFALLDELEIFGHVRDEMLAEPERALVVLEAVAGAHGVRNPAALAITRWRQGAGRPAEKPGPQHDLQVIPPDLIPPDLDALEYVWSRPPTIVGELVLRLMATALQRYGGYAALRESFARRRIGAD